MHGQNNDFGDGGAFVGAYVCNSACVPDNPKAVRCVGWF